MKLRLLQTLLVVALAAAAVGSWRFAAMVIHEYEHAQEVVLTLKLGVYPASAGSPASTLRRGLSCRRVDGRLPVDVDAELSSRFSAGIRGAFRQTAANYATSCWNPPRGVGYAFSPTCNSASLKGTPRPPMPQYPSGFLARYC